MGEETLAAFPADRRCQGRQEMSNVTYSDGKVEDWSS